MTSVDYLESAKIEELTDELRRQGFDVVERPAHVGVDLTACKGDRKIAIEVTARDRLHVLAARIRELRDQAIKCGFNEFRLVVVSPPQERTIKIDRLDRILLDHLRTTPSPEMRRLPGRASIDRVAGVDVRQIEVATEGIRVTGEASANVTVNDNTNAERGPVVWEELFPHRFDLWLDHELNLVKVLALEVDTTSFYGEETACVQRQDAPAAGEHHRPKQAPSA